MTTLAPSTRTVLLPDGRQVDVTTVAQKPTLPIQGKPNDDDKWWLLALLIGGADIESAGTFWRRVAPGPFKGLLGGRRFSFHRATQQYSRDATPLKDTDVRAAYLAVLDTAQAEMKRDAAKLTTGKLSLSDWQAAQVKRIKDLYIASRGVGVGGLDKLTPEDVRAIRGVADDDNGLANALLRLRRFGGQIERGDSTAATAPSIVNRAGMYAVPAYPIYQAGVTFGHRNAVDAKGVKIEFEQLNVLSNSDHCKSGEWTMGCEQVTEAGWKEPGILPEIGERTCNSHCRCYWAWRVKAPNKLSDLRPHHFKPGTDEPMGLSATTFRNVKLGDGRSVNVLSLNADTLAALAQCPMCKSYDVRRVPNVAGGRSMDHCRRCGNRWTHVPGSLTAEQHSPCKEMEAVGA